MIDTVRAAVTAGPRPHVPAMRSTMSTDGIVVPISSCRSSTLKRIHAKATTNTTLPR